MSDDLAIGLYTGENENEKRDDGWFQDEMEEHD